MQGKVCLVTGATSGIGLAMATEFARRGAHVLLAARDEQKCERVRREIEAATGNQALDCVIADLSLRAQVEQLSASVHQLLPGLDVLVNNAGAVFLRRRLNADGIERTLALNHLAYFHLTLRLLDLLQSAGPSRIVNVSSAMHQTARLELEDLQLERHYGGLKAYRRSKLANLLFTYELARRLHDTPVTVNAFHPGLVATNIGANNTPLIKLARPILRWVARTPEQGAETGVFLASAPEVSGVSGRYFVDCRPVSSSPASHDLRLARGLWERSLELTGLRDFDLQDRLRPAHPANAPG